MKSETSEDGWGGEGMRFLPPRTHRSVSRVDGSEGKSPRRSAWPAARATLLLLVKTEAELLLHLTRPRGFHRTAPK